MKEKTIVVFVVLLIVIAVVDVFGAYTFLHSKSQTAPEKPSPTPKPTPTTTPSPSPTPTPIPTPSPTSIQTLSPSPQSTPSATPSPTAIPTPSPPSPTPVPTPSSNSTQSINWSGYVASSDLQNLQPTVTGVAASWIVPAVDTSVTPSYSAIWIGIGGTNMTGINDTTLIQCGTEQDSRNFPRRYLGWYELLPNNTVQIPSIYLTIFPGDLIQASIQLTDVTSMLWLINISDVTTNMTFQTMVFYNSSQLTADYILERPSIITTGNSQISTLADFGAVTFTNCTATINYVNGDLGGFPWQAVTMFTEATQQNQIVQLTNTSDLSSDGLSFTITWLASG